MVRRPFELAPAAARTAIGLAARTAIGLAARTANARRGGKVRVADQLDAVAETLVWIAARPGEGTVAIARALGVPNDNHRRSLVRTLIRIGLVTSVRNGTTSASRMMRLFLTTRPTTGRPPWMKLRPAQVPEGAAAPPAPAGTAGGATTGSLLAFMDAQRQRIAAHDNVRGTFGGAAYHARGSC